MFNRRNLSLAAGMATAIALTAGALITSTAAAEDISAPTIGETAPGFTGTNSNGETVSLSDFDGKTVVLEWTNDGCPFVKKHYAEPRKNMQGMQTDAGDDDIVWLSIISSAPGKQGHVDGAGANELTTSRGAAPTHVILDPSGDIGRLYKAKTTPHMFVIEGDQSLAYMGAIDSNSSANPADIDTATNYVTAALDAVEAGTPVETTSTKPYGCSVKY